MKSLRYVLQGVAMESALELPNYWCPNKECKDYGKKGKGNIIIKEKFGKDNRHLLKCRTCKHCFSETRGTPFFCLHSTKEEILNVLAMLPEKGSIRGLARATNHSTNTISHWLNVAGEHCREVNEYYLHDLMLERVQIDEIWSYIKKRKESNR
jgi:transposase-like protein